MTSISDGLSNIEAINAQIAALQGGSSSTTGTSATDPEAFILQTQQNFNSMLDALMLDTGNKDNDDNGSSDYFSSLISSQNLQTQLATAGNSGLTTLNQTSALLGKQAVYRDQTGAEVTGVINKIMLDAAGNSMVVLDNGQQVPISSISSVI